MDKINQLKWLQTIGVEYYLSTTNCQNKILMNYSMTEKKSTKHSTVATPQAMVTKSTAVTKSKAIPIEPTEDNSKSPIELARFLADSATDLAELKELVMNFDGCGLKKFATKTVFADGNPHSNIMLIGEAPGSNEDIEGIPFCGESGKLLDNILSSINISRKHNAYISNTIFWRPPANRQPTTEEIDICRPFVEKHIALVNPKLIILVGGVAATSLLGANSGISKIKQVYYPYTNRYLTQPIQTTAIFHPAYLLRQPLQKKVMWYDLLKIEEFVLKLG